MSIPAHLRATWDGLLRLDRSWIHRSAVHERLTTLSDEALEAFEAHTAPTGMLHEEITRERVWRTLTEGERLTAEWLERERNTQ